ncbi:MAG: hypothetical protein Q8L48_37450 [Archangium sp.]|nr:hypothetical protein [Archangium sp.]
MRRLLWVVLLTAGCVRAPLMTNNSGASSAQSGDSSARTGNSSGQSANSSAASGTSGNSAQSSGGSAASSNGSAASSAASQQSSNGSNASTGSSNASSGSSNQSSNSTRNSSATVQSSAESSNASSAAPSSTVVAGSALLLAVAGGIITTVYTANQRAEARLQHQQLKQLQQAPVPQPMPYKVEPIPLEPGIPGQQPPPPPLPPPPPPPEFEPAPFPQSSTGQLRSPRAESAAESRGEPDLDAMVMARSWLLANELQLEQDLALGAGPTIDDLAGIAGITPSRRAHFGRVLQRHRGLLLAPHELTPQQAAAVMAQVGALVMADPLLREDARAFLAER